MDDYERIPTKLPAYTCLCERKFKEGEDPIFRQFKVLKELKEKKNYRKYPAPEKIIDFNFEAGKDIAVMDKEKKPPKSGKIKMKHYGGEGWTKF